MGIGSYVTKTLTCIPGLAVLLDARVLSSVQNTGGSVTSWNDIGGRLNAAPQGSGASQPLTGSQTINGRNSILFDGVDDFLEFTSNNIFDQPFTMFVVAQASGIATAQTFVSRGSGGANGSYVLRVNGDSTNFTAFGTGPGSTFATSNRPVNTNPNIHCVKFNLTTTYSINNGTPEVSSTLGSFDNASAAAARIGILANGTQPLAGKMGCIALYSGILNDEYTTDVFRCLGNEWGIAV